MFFFWILLRRICFHPYVCKEIFHASKKTQWTGSEVKITQNPLDPGTLTGRMVDKVRNDDNHIHKRFPKVPPQSTFLQNELITCKIEHKKRTEKDHTDY